jgi:hypothetical protein
MCQVPDDTCILTCRRTQAGYFSSSGRWRARLCVGRRVRRCMAHRRLFRRTSSVADRSRTTMLRRRRIGRAPHDIGSSCHPARLASARLRIPEDEGDQDFHWSSLRPRGILGGRSGDLRQQPHNISLTPRLPGETHVRHRKILAPAFTAAPIRQFLPIFRQKAAQVRGSTCSRVGSSPARSSAKTGEMRLLCLAQIPQRTWTSREASPTRR